MLNQTNLSVLDDRFVTEGKHKGLFKEYDEIPNCPDYILVKKGDYFVAKSQHLRGYTSYNDDSNPKTKQQNF